MATWQNIGAYFLIRWDVLSNTSLESAHYSDALHNPIHVHVYFFITEPTSG